MARRLAKIYGTDADKVNCTYYIKTGTCLYGEKCVKIHNKPPASPLILIK